MFDLELDTFQMDHINFKSTNALNHDSTTNVPHHIDISLNNVSAVMLVTKNFDSWLVI